MIGSECQIRQAGVGDRWPHAAFHVRFAPVVVDRLTRDLRDVWRAAEAPSLRLRHDDPMGFGSAMTKTAVYPSWGIDPHLRSLSPLYDRRLLNYVATLPAGFVLRNDRNRAIARALMRGRLPDAIVLREKGMAYSPSYYTMIADQAAAARRRIPLFRANGIGEWIDLPWLETRLQSLDRPSAIGLDEAFRIQATTIFAEFLMWWNGAAITV